MHRTMEYLTTFALKCFVLAVAAVSAELRAILLNSIYKILRFLCHFVNCAHIGQCCAEFCADVRIVNSVSI